MSDTHDALLVEDDPDVAALLLHHLESLHFTVLHVTSAEEALAGLDECTPEVAVIDILLPGQDGRAVVRGLRESPKHRGCRIVVASIIDRDDLDVEVDAVLPKPFRRTDLVRALGHAEQPGGAA